MSDDILSRRMTEIESALAHLQNDFEAINETVLIHEKMFEKMQAQIDKLTERLEQNETPESPRDPQDEKPPHY